MLQARILFAFAASGVPLQRRRVAPSHHLQLACELSRRGGHKSHGNVFEASSSASALPVMPMTSLNEVPKLEGNHFAGNHCSQTDSRLAGSHVFDVHGQVKQRTGTRGDSASAAGRFRQARADQDTQTH